MTSTYLTGHLTVQLQNKKRGPQSSFSYFTEWSEVLIFFRQGHQRGIAARRRGVYADRLLCYQSLD